MKFIYFIEKILFFFFFRLNESNIPSCSSSQSRSDRIARKSIDEAVEPSSDELGMNNQLEKKKQLRMPFVFM